MAIKLFGSSITSVYKSVVSTVSKNVSKGSGGSGSKSSSANSKSSSSWNKTSGSSKSSSSGNKASGSSSNKTSSSGNKASATATSKTVSSNVSKQSTTTKYVKDAAAIYNASGKKVSTPSSVSTGRSEQSYTTQKKVGSASSQKTSGNASSVKTTNAKVKTVTTTSSKSTYSKSSLSVSTRRPDQSYATQKKASTTYNQKTSGNSSKQAKLPVPVAQKAPVVKKTSTSKKDPSEASYSNNRPKQSYTHVVAYKPSPSREGAGQVFYMNKTNTKALKAGASFATSCIPYVGDAKDIQEAVTGKDLITGEKLTGNDRVLTIASAGLPFVTGPMLKSAKNGGKIAVEKAPDVVKGAEKLIKKNAPKVKKAVNKADVAEDAAKAMKKKAVEKAKEGNKVRKTVDKGSSNDKIYTKVEYKGTVKVDGKIKDVSRKVYQRNDINYNYLDETTGLTNLERMQAGKPPIGSDGNPIQLHHILQKEAGPMVEIREITHQEYYSQLHGLIEDGASFRNNSALNRQYNNFRRSYWKWRAK